MPSKRFKKLPEKTKDLTADMIENLLTAVKNNCTTKFDESIDLSFQVNNKQKKGEVNIRTVVNLPGGTGKKVKVAVVCEDAKVQEAKDAGADIVGSDEFIDKIKAGEIDFEIKSPPASHFIKEAAKLKGGSKEPGRSIAGSITKKQAEEIATQKMKDLNAHDLEQAVKIIAGSARSMGIEVKD